jgi:methylenetetrahydrofolate reductase (NADPH)
MSSPASETELRLRAPHLSTIAELVTGGSLEISPRELHRAAEVAALLPKDTCVYVPSLPGLPLSRTLEMVAALRAAGLDPVPHVSARRILDKEEFKRFLKKCVSEHGVHRVLVIGGDEPKAKGPYNDSLEVLRDGIIADAGIREIGVSGYPEGHPKISSSVLTSAFEAKLQLARERAWVSTSSPSSFAPKRVVEFCSTLARSAPDVSVYVGIAGPSDPAALLRYAQRCGVSTSLRALRNLGTGIARLVVHTDPQEQVAALGGYLQGREAGNVVGVHLYSFGGAVRTASWMRERISA